MLCNNILLFLVKSTITVIVVISPIVNHANFISLSTAHYLPHVEE